MYKWVVCIFVFFASLSLQGQNEEEKADPQISIYFGGGSYYIDRGQTQKLSDFLEKINILNDYEIIIHSHTDNIGSMEYNKWLSRMRSESAILKLMESEIPRDMIHIEDFGEKDPVYDNDYYLGKLKNRRVDIVLWPLPS